MTTGLWGWSKTAATDATADANVNLRDNQAPSVVKTNMRTFMAKIAEWRDDNAGILDTGGTSTAYTVTTNGVLTALTDGFTVELRMHVANGTAPTLTVDGTAAKNMTIAPATAPDALMFPLGSVQRFVYDAGDDEWRAKSIFIPGGTFKTGDKKEKFTSVVDPGWVMADGRTIGNASSSATSRANSDTSALFQQLWAEYNNTKLPIQDSSGSPSTRGLSAAADFAANKRLPLPDLSGRLFAGLDSMSGTSRNVVTDGSADTLGGTMGEETHALTTGELATHAHAAGTLDVTANSAAATATNSGSSASGVQAGVSFSAFGNGQYNDASVTGSTASAGSGTAHNNMQPTFFGYVFIKL